VARRVVGPALRPVLVIGALLVLAAPEARAADGSASAVRLQQTLDRTARLLESRSGLSAEQARLLTERLRQTFEREQGVHLRNPLGDLTAEERSRLLPAASSLAVDRSQETDADRARRAHEVEQRLAEMKTHAEQRWGRGSPRARSFLRLCQESLERRFEVDLPEIATELSAAERTALWQERFDALVVQFRRRGLTPDALRDALTTLQKAYESRYAVRLAGVADDDLR
jgi:hypothetical protein